LVTTFLQAVEVVDLCVTCRAHHPAIFSVLIIHDYFSYLSHCLAARMQAILQL